MMTPDANPPGSVGRGRVNRLIDRRTGLITRVVCQPHRERTPRALTTFAGCVSALHCVSNGIADPFGYGSALGNPEAAWWAAVGESVERYCGNIIPRQLRRAGYAELKNDDCLAIDPASLRLYSDRQYRMPGFPFVPFGSDLAVRWVPTVNLLTGESVLAPASLVYLNPYRGLGSEEPRTNFIIYAGIAAGGSVADAQRAAIEEVIERDATTIWWHSGGPAAGIRLDSIPGLVSILSDPEADYLRWTLVHIPTIFGVPVVGALVEDSSLGIFAFGCACRANPEEAAIKAAAEALQVYILAMDLLEEKSPLWRAVKSGALEAEAYTPHRADRTYRDAFRPDYLDVTDLAMQVQLWLDVRLHDSLLDRLQRPKRWVRLDDLPCIRGDRLVDEYVNIITKSGFSIFGADLTTPDVLAGGLHVVRVVIPGMYGNAPPAFPFLGGQRLYTDPVRLGLVADLKEDDLVRRPLPFA